MQGCMLFWKNDFGNSPSVSEMNLDDGVKKWIESNLELEIDLEKDIWSSKSLK